MEVKHESSYVDALKSVAERIDGDGDVSVIEGVKQATDTLRARDNQDSVNKETMQ